MFHLDQGHFGNPGPNDDSELLQLFIDQSFTKIPKNEATIQSTTNCIQHEQQNHSHSHRHHDGLPDSGVPK